MTLYRYESSRPKMQDEEVEEDVPKVCSVTHRLAEN